MSCFLRPSTTRSWSSQIHSGGLPEDFEHLRARRARGIGRHERLKALPVDPHRLDGDQLPGKAFSSQSHSRTASARSSASRSLVAVEPSGDAAPRSRIRRVDSAPSCRDSDHSPGSDAVSAAARSITELPCRKRMQTGSDCAFAPGKKSPKGRAARSSLFCTIAA